jgi:MbtH protein
MSNPFESEEHQYRVLRNEEGQYSLWPVFAPVPAGWSSVFGPENRAACVSFVETSWTDMRPLSLARLMS